MANCLLISECRDMDRSTGGAGPSAPSPFRDAVKYPAANHRSTLGEDKLRIFYDEYDIPRTLWYIYPAAKKDRIWNNPPVLEMHGKIATGLSEAALKCGFRVPTLPLLKHLFEEMGIALGQLDPNSFIHINVFQARCTAANVDPRRTSLFWNHYEFRRNSKSKGYYTIARKTNRADWAQTNSNNKESHLKWFFFSGPKIAKYSVWKDVEPKDIVMPSLLGADAENYRKLCMLDMDKIPLSLSRDHDWLLALWGNGGNNVLFLSCFYLQLSFFICLRTPWM